MKLLFDENLSHHLVVRLANLYPGSMHVRDVNLKSADDDAIWAHATLNDFVIVSKDGDFYHRSSLHGHPPRVIWMRTGNSSTRLVEMLLRKLHRELEDFHSDMSRAFLTVTGGDPEE